MSDKKDKVENATTTLTTVFQKYFGPTIDYDKYEKIVFESNISDEYKLDLIKLLEKMRYEEKAKIEQPIPMYPVPYNQPQIWYGNRTPEPIFDPYKITCDAEH